MRIRLTLTALLALMPAANLPAVVWAEAATTEAATEVAAPHITVSKVETRQMRDIIIASGLIGAVEQVQVAPLVEGQPIEALLADVGDLVTEGQVLARLSTSSLMLQKAQLTASLAAARATVTQAQAQADEAGRVAERTQKLLDQGTYSQANADKATAGAISAAQTLESARANLALAEAQMANVELMLSRTEVKAPVGGEITARNAQIGAIASAAGQPMFTLIRDGAMELRADVAEGDILRLAPGQTVALHLQGDAAARKGTVRLVEPSIDLTTRMGRVRITLDEATGVRPGMYASAEVLVAERDALAVPITSLGISPDGPTVLQVTGDIAQMVQVQTGIRQAGWVEVVQGLEPGAQVVTKAGAFVRDGDRITAVAAKE